MIILDNSVLSAFKRLKLLSKLKILISSATISKEVFNEYSKQWQKKIPKWIDITKPKEETTLESIPLSLSIAKSFLQCFIYIWNYHFHIVNNFTKVFLSGSDEIALSNVFLPVS